MANRIKGISVEISGDTTKLSKALKNVDSSIKNTQNQLRDVNKLLKLAPGNTELLQKHKLLLSLVRCGKCGDMIESITVYEDRLIVEFKSGTQVKIKRK